MALRVRRLGAVAVAGAVVEEAIGGGGVVVGAEEVGDGAETVLLAHLPVRLPGRGRRGD